MNLSELKKKQKSIQKKVDNKKHKIAENDRITKNGYRVVKVTQDEGEVTKHVKITSTEELELNVENAKLNFELIELEDDLKNVTYQLETRLKIVKQEIKSAGDAVVKRVMERTDKERLELLKKASENGSLEKLKQIAINVEGERYPFVDFQKSIIPILNEYRNKRKQRPITSLRKHTTEKLIAKVKELSAQKLLTQSN